MLYCPNCGEEVDEGFNICLHCGQRLGPSPETRVFTLPPTVVSAPPSTSGEVHERSLRNPPSLSGTGTRLPGHRANRTSLVLIVAVIALIIVLALVVAPLPFGNGTAIANYNVPSLQTQISSSLAQISALNNQMTSNRARISSLSTQVASDNSAISLDTSTIGNLQAKIGRMGSELSGNISEVSTLQTQASSYESSINSLTSQVQGLQSQVASDQSTINTLQTQAASDQSTIGSLQNEVTSDESQIQSLNNEVSTQSSIINLQNTEALETNYDQQMSLNTIAVSWTYQFQYTGYVTISYSSTQNVNYEFDGGNIAMTSYNSTSASGVIFPVVAGQSYKVILHNDSCGAFGCSAVDVIETITFVY